MRFEKKLLSTNSSPIDDYKEFIFNGINYLLLSAQAKISGKLFYNHLVNIFYFGKVNLKMNSIKFFKEFPNNEVCLKFWQDIRRGMIYNKKTFVPVFEELFILLDPASRIKLLQDELGNSDYFDLPDIFSSYSFLIGKIFQILEEESISALFDTASSRIQTELQKASVLLKNPQLDTFAMLRPVFLYNLRKINFIGLLPEVYQEHLWPLAFELLQTLIQALKLLPYYESQFLSFQTLPEGLRQNLLKWLKGCFNKREGLLLTALRTIEQDYSAWVKRFYAIIEAAQYN